MRILHLSDFHFKSSERDIASQNLLIEKLVNHLIPDQKIDFFLFTGDLVNSGTKLEDFSMAYESFLKKIGERLNIPEANFLICPGNHDVDRGKISEPIKAFIRGFTKSEQIISLIEENKEDEFGISCKPLDNYYQFEKQFYSDGVVSKIDEINRLYSIHIRECEKWKIGFVSMNTAWCSTGDDDKGNLFFPRSELEKAIEKLNLEKVDWKILLLHHPLADFRDFNRADIEDLIYTEFHLMFSGHLHKREDFMRLMQNEGIFCTYAHATLTKREDGKIGYTILDIDLETLEINIERFVFDSEEKIFYALKEMNCTFPCNDLKRDQIKILKTLRRRLHEALDKANELCVTTKDINPMKGFFELFVDPVLRSEPQVEALTGFIPSIKVSFKALYLPKNYLIYGRDKTGKTSLLYKVLIDLLKNYSQLGEIPFYVDLADFKVKPHKLDLPKLIGKYLEHTHKQTEELLKTYKFKILIDNFDPSKEEIRKNLSSFFNTYSQCSYVIISDQTMAQSYEIIDYGFDGYEKLFIHDISRTEIRQLTRKWPNIPDEKRDEFVDRIVDVLNQHSMPFNFWTLSIFLWIFSGRNTLNFNSNSELLELYIDDIIDRTKLASDPQNRFSYSNYKILLSELANHLLLNFRETNYSIKYVDFITFVEKFKSENVRRVGKTSDIVAHLLERGILKKLEDDFITFRLNGVFEYFIAFNFIDNQKFLEKILSDDNFYLSFKNEFEIYSGFQRSESDNKEFLNKIFEKTKGAFSELNARMIGELDIRLKESISDKELIDLSKPISSLISNRDLLPMSDEQKDDFFDEMEGGFVRNIEVKPKKIYDVSVKNSDILERYLLISGRVFKNIDNIKDAKKVDEIFNFVIDSSCNLAFLLLEEFEQLQNENNVKEIDYSDPNSIVFQLFNNYLPSVVQTFIHDAMGHINLEGMIKSKIDTLKKDFQNNQFKLFILYCLLLDIDLKKYKQTIDDLIKYSRMGIIKSSVLLKLSYLLIFKSYEDDEMIAFLKEKIRQVQLSIDPDIDMREFEQKFEKAKKLLLLKRNAHRLN